MIDRISATDACPLCGFWTCRCPVGAEHVHLFAIPTDSDPDMDEALRRVRQGR